MKKKILSIVLSLAMVLTMVPMMSGAAYAEAAAPQAPTDLAWDGTAATWNNPNEDGVVAHVYVYLYNTKDTSSPASSVGGGKDMTYYDFNRSLVPGDTYYFEVCLRDSNYAESLTVKSPNYIVPGSYIKKPVGNLQFGRNGELTWDKNEQYITFYKSVLYEKAGDEWNKIEEANAM